MIKRTLLGLLLLLVSIANAQITEGYLKYKIDYKGDSAEMEMAASMMNNATLEISFDEKRSRVDMNTPGMYSLATVVDDSKNEVLLIFEVPMMGQKKYVKTSISNLEVYNDKSSKDDKPAIRYLNETKEIAGFKCKKAVLDMNGTEVVYWYTDKIKMNTSGQDQFDLELDGHPLEFETKAEGLSIKFTVTEFSETFKKDKSILFSTKAPAGYQETSLEKLNSGGF